jgi:hypothetical protein
MARRRPKETEPRRIRGHDNLAIVVADDTRLVDLLDILEEDPVGKGTALGAFISRHRKEFLPAPAVGHHHGLEHFKDIWL